MGKMDQSQERGGVGGNGTRYPVFYPGLDPSFKDQLGLVPSK